MLNRDHGSGVAKGPYPGNWEVARPVDICRICSGLVVVYLWAHVRACGCFHSRGLPPGCACAGLP